MPSLMDRITDRITDFLKPKTQEADQAPPDVATNGGGAVETPAATPKKRPAMKGAAKKKPAAKKAAGDKPAAKGKAKTREQLYKEATRLKVAGRSKMSKVQLERAIAKKK